MDDEDTSKQSKKSVQPNSSLTELFSLLCIPRAIIDSFASVKNIRQLHPWQKQCLLRVLDGKGVFGADLVYSAPTSGGKSLVAEILLLHTIFAKPGGISLIILPYVALAEEKANAINSIFIDNCTDGTLHADDMPIIFCCAGRAGIHGACNKDMTERSIIAVCTIEKANMIINEYIRCDRGTEIRLLVIDEVHLIEESLRGYLLEMIIAKVLYTRLLNADASQAKANMLMNMVLLSASLVHSKDVYRWIESVNRTLGHQTVFFDTIERPVGLDSFVVIDGQVQDANGVTVRSLSAGGKNRGNILQSDLFAMNTDGEVCSNYEAHESALHDIAVLSLVEETILNKNQVMIFCATKKICERVALFIGQHLQHLLQTRNRPYEEFHRFLSQKLENFLDGCEFNATLCQALEKGTVFHHSGLSHEERWSVEQLFRSREVHVLCCTTTLSVGVNLPVARVIFCTPLCVGRNNPLSTVGYIQAAGRAGRMGFDARGDSYLVAQSAADRKTAVKLLQATTLDPHRSFSIHSAFETFRMGLFDALLESIELGHMKSAQDLELFVKCTLFYFVKGHNAAFQCAKEALSALEANGFINWSRRALAFSSTSLGKACILSNIMSLDGMILYRELYDAQNTLHVHDMLQLLLCIIPQNHLYGHKNHEFLHQSSAHESILCTLQPEWTGFYTEFYDCLPSATKEAAKRMGVNEGFLIQAQQLGGQYVEVKSNDSFAHVHEVHRRFYVSLILRSIIHESGAITIAKKFHLHPAEIQKIMEAASLRCTRVAAFCGVLGWWLLQSVYEKFATRVALGVRDDLVALMKLPSMDVNVARAFLRAGIAHVAEIAQAPVSVLCNHIEKCTSLNKSGEALESYMAMLKEEASTSVSCFIPPSLKSVAITKLSSTGSNSQKTHYPGKIASISNCATKNPLPTPIFTIAEDDTSIHCTFVSIDEALRQIDGEETFFTLFAFTDLTSRLPMEQHETPNRRTILACFVSKKIAAFISPCSSKSHFRVILEFLSNPNHKKICPYLTHCISILLHWGEQTGQQSSEDSIIRYLRLRTANIYDVSTEITEIDANKKTPHIQLNNSLHLSTSQLDALKSFFRGSIEFFASLQESNKPYRIKNYSQFDVDLLVALAISASKGMPLKAREVTMQLNTAKRGTIYIRACFRLFANALGHKKQLSIEKYSHVKRLMFKILHPNARDSAPLSISSLESIIKMFPDNRYLAELIVSFRKLRNISEPLSLYIARLMEDKGGRIHGSFVTEGNPTGRITMRNPDLQMVPHAFTAFGLEINIRTAFAVQNELKILSFDFMHIELRVFAALSRDKSLIAELNIEGSDFFQRIAANIFSCDVEAVSPDLRRQAKAICYGILYGRGMKSIAKELMVPVEQIASFVTKIQNQYRELFLYRKKAIEKCAREGFITTINQRILRIDQINSLEKNTRRAAERSAINQLIQGSAADIMRLAIVNVYKLFHSWYVAAEKAEDLPHTIMYIHDEILVECLYQHAPCVASHVKKTMEQSAAIFNIHIPVRVSEGSTWSDIQK